LNDRNILDTIKVHDEMMIHEKTKRPRAINESIFADRFGDGDNSRDMDNIKDKKKSYLLDLFCASGQAKVANFIEHLALFTQDPDSGKVLVFAHHRAVLDEVDSYLTSVGLDHIRIDGQTVSKDRYARVNYFQDTPSCRVAVLAITAAGVAISLTSASTVFFVELFCTYSSYLS
jgi:SWI/SNF-related matrix-associated actin-dependent regulator 1 of chromatin subfamily A